MMYAREDSMLNHSLLPQTKQTTNESQIHMRHRRSELLEHRQDMQVDRDESMAYGTRMQRQELSLSLTNIYDRHGFNGKKSRELKEAWAHGPPLSTPLERTTRSLEIQLRETARMNSLMQEELSECKAELAVNKTNMIGERDLSLDNNELRRQLRDCIAELAASKTRKTGGQDFDNNELRLEWQRQTSSNNQKHVKELENLKDLLRIKETKISTLEQDLNTMMRNSSEATSLHVEQPKIEIRNSNVQEKMSSVEQVVNTAECDGSCPSVVALQQELHLLNIEIQVGKSSQLDRISPVPRLEPNMKTVHVECDGSCQSVVALRRQLNLLSFKLEKSQSEIETHHRSQLSQICHACATKSLPPRCFS